MLAGGKTTTSGPDGGYQLSELALGSYFLSARIDNRNRAMVDSFDHA